MAEFSLERIFSLDFLCSLITVILAILAKKGHIFPKMSHRLRDDLIIAQSSHNYAHRD